MNALTPDAPPAVQALEQSLLGTLLANNKAYESVGSFLLPEHFSDPVHSMLYRKIAERIGQGRLVDALLLKADLENDRMLEAAGGTAYLALLLSSMVSITGSAEYGSAIKDAWAKREMLAALQEAERACSGYTSDRSAREIAAEAIAKLTELAEPAISRPSLAKAAEAVMAAAEGAHQGKAGFERLDVGLPSVDRLIGGLWPSNFYCLMAYSGTGKTPMLLQICRHVARTIPDGHVHLFSLEVPVEDVLRIGAGAESRWTAEQIRRGEIGDAEDWLALQEVMRAQGELRLVVDDGPTDIDTFRSRARQIKRTKKTRLIAVDYIELIGRDQRRRNMPRNEWIPSLRQDIKNLAVELELPILALSQINKPRDDQAPRRPTKDNLPFDSGQAVDQLHALFRREMHMGDDPPGLAMLHSDQKRADARSEWNMQKRAARGAVEWIGLRKRMGELTTAHLRFDGPRQLFREKLPADNGPSEEEIDMFTRGEP